MSGQREALRRLAEGLAAFRRLGPRRGSAAVARLALGRVRGPARAARLKVRPLRVSRGQLASALAGLEPDRALRELALPALPTVAAWERELAALDAPARSQLLDRADRILGHRFDLLGSGPTELGPEIDWSLDFKSGRRWPDVHVSRLPIVLGGGADIKVPWELSRCQHLPLLAAAHRLSGDRRFLDELGAQLRSFIAANPVEFGPCWGCTMDVAIRAANWVAALCIAMPQAAEAPWLEEAMAALLLHCRFIRGHLEWGEVRGNHYLSDVAGLLLACAPFSAGEEGRRWASWATAELEREMAHQVRADGCDHEASIPYHRLVCELFVCGTQAAEALCPGVLSDSYRKRLALMLGFVADYTRPDGLAPQMGDADDGRFLPLGAYGQDPRDHRHLFAQAGMAWEPAHGHAAHAEGGWYVMRHGELWAIVRCGDVGLEGVGAHAHNDQLSFELALAGQPLVVDPGSYLYTADPRARNDFRSTRAHSTLMVGGAEQNRLRSDYLFSMPEEAHARCLEFAAEGASALFRGEHSGFRTLPRPVRHRRELRFDGEAELVEIVDHVSGAAGQELLWSFPLAPCEAAVEGSSAIARLEGGVTLRLECSGAELAVEEGWLAPSYGVRVSAPVVRARRVASSAEEQLRFSLYVVRSR